MSRIRIEVRCTENEKAVIQTNANLAGMRASAYLRELGLKGTSAISQGLYQAAHEPEKELKLNILVNKLLQSLYELVQGICAADLIQPEGQRRFALFSTSLLEARQAMTFKGADYKQVYRDLSQAIYELNHPDLADIKGQFDAHQSHKRQ